MSDEALKSRTWLKRIAITYLIVLIAASLAINVWGDSRYLRLNAWAGFVGAALGTIAFPRPGLRTWQIAIAAAFYLGMGLLFLTCL